MENEMYGKTTEKNSGREVIRKKVPYSDKLRDIEFILG